MPQVKYYFSAGLLKSGGTSLLSDLVIDLPPPHLLSISFARYRLALDFYFIFSESRLVAKRCFCVCEWPQGLLTRLLWNKNASSAMDVGIKSLSHYLGENNWRASDSCFLFCFAFCFSAGLCSAFAQSRLLKKELQRGTVPAWGH